MRILTSTVLLMALSAPAMAQDSTPAANAERLAFGFFAGPAHDRGDPWFFTGIRLTMPAGRRLSLDLESSVIHGAQGDLARFHGWAAAKLRFQKTPAATSSRYWIAGVGMMPGDKLALDGSVLEQRRYSVLVLGVGARQLMARRTRISTELEFHGGNRLGLLATASVQFGLRHRPAGAVR